MSDVESLQKALDKNAKTLSDLFWENNLEWNEWLSMGVTEAKQVALAPKYQGKWVSVETVTALLTKLFQELNEYKETCAVLSDEKLMKAIRKGRKKGSKSSPYKPLLLELLPEKLLLDRKKLSDLLKDAPSYEELDDIGGMQNISVQMWGSRVEEWISKVKEFVESSGEPLNLALAFTDVKKKKGSMKEAKP